MAIKQTAVRVVADAGYVVAGSVLQKGQVFQLDDRLVDAAVKKGLVEKYVEPIPAKGALADTKTTGVTGTTGDPAAAQKPSA